ncbi:MAG: helix-turn-helix transcriptional regulator [Caulobacterales bacterium]
MLLRLPVVMRETGLSRSSIYAAIKDGAFPRPVRIGKRAVAWRFDEIEAWKAARQPTPAPFGGDAGRGARRDAPPRSR